MKTLADFDFSGKRALIRVDFNVPLNDTFDVTDDTRIRAALPTIQHIIQQGGSVVLMSHLGRPQKKRLANGDVDVKKFTLKHTVSTIEQLLGTTVQFAEDCIGQSTTEKVNQLNGGEVLLLENLRFYAEESSGDENFAEQLSALGDIYVNDAFGTAHRAHASTTVVARYFGENKCFGLLIQKELESVSQVLENNEKPVSAVIGGAKVSSKITIIENLLNKVDNLLIGGGMAFTFAKAMGGSVGNSLVEDDCLDLARDILEKAEACNVRILLPEDSIAADAFSADANILEADTNSIPDGYMGLDIGPKAREHYTTCLLESKTILWNGPMGVFEMAPFEAGTKAVAYAIVQATERGAFSLVGGGDSVAAINKYELAAHVNHVSTGGGAMLEYLEGKTLPGIAAILD